MYTSETNKQTNEEISMTRSRHGTRPFSNGEIVFFFSVILSFIFFSTARALSLSLTCKQTPVHLPIVCVSLLECSGKHGARNKKTCDTGVYNTRGDNEYEGLIMIVLNKNIKLGKTHKENAQR